LVVAHFDCRLQVTSHTFPFLTGNRVFRYCICKLDFASNLRVSFYPSIATAQQRSCEALVDKSFAGITALQAARDSILVR
jgi:hypothetical protein